MSEPHSLHLWLTGPLAVPAVVIFSRGVVVASFLSALGLAP